MICPWPQCQWQLAIPALLPYYVEYCGQLQPWWKDISCWFYYRMQWHCYPLLTNSIHAPANPPSEDGLWCSWESLARVITKTNFRSAGLSVMLRLLRDASVLVCSVHWSEEVRMGSTSEQSRVAGLAAKHLDSPVSHGRRQQRVRVTTPLVSKSLSDAGELRNMIKWVSQPLSDPGP